jgi:MFS family permease
MILTMTLAQVAGAIPITRLGRNQSAATFLKLLVAFRAVALAAVALCAHYHASFAWLIVFAALAGLVNGAAFGYLRSLLNHFTTPSRLPRALGIAATLNELTFVLGPVVASGLGAVSPVFALLAITALGAIPALFVPQAGNTHVKDVPHVARVPFSPPQSCYGSPAPRRAALRWLPLRSEQSRLR